MKTLKKIILILVIVLVLLLLGVWLGTRNNTVLQPEDDEQIKDNQAENALFSWEEYLTLTLEEQDSFFREFGSVEEFEKWMDSVKPTEDTVSAIVWDLEGKQPDQYTWEEYQALSPEYQEAFFQWFASKAAFEAWVETVKPAQSTEPTYSWSEKEKAPDKYTWEEYQALSPAQREAFYQWFASAEAFEKWMNSVKPSEETEPTPTWNKPGKTPDEYTWEEYQKLDKKDQDAFFLWFGSADQFEKWVESVKPEETTAPLPGWNKPGKKPNEYTWEEYQRLSLQEQDAFYLWFGSVDRFEQWMNSIKPAAGTEAVPNWSKPGKTPDEYTLEEYQKLSPEEQDAFFMWFENVTAFEAWMEAARG